MKLKQIWQQGLVSALLCASLTSLSHATIPNIQSASDYYGYPAITDTNSDMVTQLGESFGGTILASFALSDELRYVVVEVEQGQESHIVYQGMKEGKATYGILHSEQGNMEVQSLLTQLERVENSANITLDYSLFPLYSKEEGFVSYLKESLQSIQGASLNAQAKAHIAQYIQVVLQQMASIQGYADSNILLVEGESFQTGIQRQNQQETAFLTLLEEENVSLNQTIEKNIQVIAQQMDQNLPMQLTLEKSILMALQPEMHLNIQIAESQFALNISQELLVDYFKEQQHLSIMWSDLGARNYAIHFYNGQGEKIDKLSAPVTLTLPAYSPYETVEIQYSGGKETWGGQWDPGNQAISFQTAHSGEYAIVDGSQALEDIQDMAGIKGEEELAFLLSKGFFQANQGQFQPTAPLSRYDLSFALVGMLYALDRDHSLDYEDVARDSFYYAYVASAQEKNWLPDLDENMFQGSEGISQEGLFVLLAQILLEETATLPLENETGYLDFPGAEKANPDAESAIALCYREGIILRGETINPQEDISRGQAGIYLKRLFDLLYEVPPVSTYYSAATPPVSQDLENIAIFNAFVFGAWALVFGLVATLDHGLRKADWKRKQKKKAKKAETKLAKGGEG